MGTITILPETTKNPLTLIGKRAGVCYGSDINNQTKNLKRGMNCIQSGHGRVLEFVNIEMIIDGYSTRVIREWYTHIGGSPTRLQASTRYIDYDKFSYVTPTTIQSNEAAKMAYDEILRDVMDYCNILKNKYQIPQEDVAMLLPLAMSTKIVDKRNLRNLIDMSHNRKCNRAYWEFRELFSDIEQALSGYSKEWNWIVQNLFEAKCKYFGKCTERNSCNAK